MPDVVGSGALFAQRLDRLFDLQWPSGGLDILAGMVRQSAQQCLGPLLLFLSCQRWITQIINVLQGNIRILVFLAKKPIGQCRPQQGVTQLPRPLQAVTHTVITAIVTRHFGQRILVVEIAGQHVPGLLRSGSGQMLLQIERKAGADFLKAFFADGCEKIIEHPAHTQVDDQIAVGIHLQRAIHLSAGERRWPLTQFTPPGHPLRQFCCRCHGGRCHSGRWQRPRGKLPLLPDTLFPQRIQQNPAWHQHHTNDKQFRLPTRFSHHPVIHLP